MAINLQAIQEDKRQRELAAMTPEPEEKGLLDSLYDSIVRASDYVDGPELKEEGYSEIVEPATSLYLKTIDNEIKAANNYQQAVDNWESNDAVDYARGNLMASPFKEAGREFINAYADDTKNSPFFSAGANDLMQSNIGYNYIMNDEDKLSRARKIEQEIGIPSGTVLYDKEAWTNANKLYENIQKQKDFFSENGKEMSLEDVQKLNPILTRISTSDPAAGALIMADMGNIKKQMDIFDTFDEYLEVGKLKLELDNLGEKYRKNEQTFDDMYRMQELQDKINRFYDKHDNNFFDSPLNFAVAGLASSWPEMQGSIEEGLKEQAFWTMAGIQAGGIVGTGFGGVGVAPGAAIGGLGGFGMGVLRNFPRLAKAGGIILKNMTPGKYTGFKLGSFGGMAAPETGSRYLEYRDMKDKDGNQVMTRDEASDRAVIGGTVNAALETFPTFGAMGRMAKGNKAGKEVVDLIFRGAEKKYTEPIAKTAAAEFALNTLKGAAVESGEESLQTAADDLMLNDIEKTHPGTIEGGIKSYKDIATDALGAFVMSYPTSLLFGAAEGLGTGAFSTSRYAAQHKQIRAQEQIFGEQVQNTAIGNALVSELQSAVQNSKLKDTAPDVQQQIIKEKAAGTGYEIVYIDTEMAMEKESGRKDLEAVAKAANISSEELETAIEEKGTLAVPLECFAQADSSPELLESASYKTEAQSIARMKKEAIETIQRLKEADQKHLGQLKNMVDVVAEEYFPADENDKQGKARQDMCKAIIMTFAENPAMGWNEMMKMVQSERMELLQPALDFINETSGKGTVVIPTEDGKGFRATNNFQWYSEWSKNHNYRAMTKADKEELAEEMVRGNAQIGDFRGPVEAFVESGRKLDEINGKIKALEEIKDKMKELNGVEMRLTEGLTKEGFSVYRAVYEQLKEAKGYAPRSARTGAIVYARHADLHAKIMREKGQTNYTAKDFMKRNIIQFGGQTVGEFNQITNLYLNLDAKVEPLDLTGVAGPKTKVSVIKAYIKGLVGNNFSMPVAEGKAIISVWKKDIGHLTYSSRKKMAKQELAARNGSILSIPDLLKSAVLVETIPNTKSYKKPNILNYHRFYVPIKIGNKIYTMRLVAEERKDFFTVQPTAINLYDVVTESKKPSTVNPVSKTGTHTVNDSKISIRELLTNVNDYKGRPYINPDGTGNFVDPTMYQMAGENAKTAALDKLEQAKSMEQAGKLPDDIYKETGWLKGKDGKWRFEIPDNLDAIKADEFISEGAAAKWPLGRLYENDALYEAYPFLRNVQVILADQVEGNANGVYDPHANIISIDYRDGKITPNDLNSTLIHEIQHVIQGKEGFASGGSVDTVIEQIETRISNLVRELEGGLVVKDNSAVELDELLKQRGDLIVKSNNAVFDGKLDDVKVIEDERKAVEEKIQELLPNRNLNEVFKIDSQIEYLHQKMKEFHEAKPGEEKNAVLKKLYFDLAGEQEARRTSSRAISLNERTQKALNTETEMGRTSLSFEKEYNNASEENRELMNEYMRLNGEFEASNDESVKEDLFNQREAVEEKLNKTEQGKKLVASFNDKFFSEWEREDAWKDVNEYSKSMPQPHSYDAIIVFNGVSYSAENSEAAEINRYINKQMYGYPQNSDSNTQPVEKFYQSAWHGSPYDFDEFDLGAIGSGEGAQAHGWGLYFAADRKISEGYKKQLSGQITIDGDIYRAIEYSQAKGVMKNERYVEDEILFRVVRAIEKEGTYEKAVEKLKKDSTSGLKGLAAKSKKALEMLQKYSPESVYINKGKLFEVDIPDSNVMLDEQKTLAEQPEKVRKAVTELLHSFVEQYSYKKKGDKYVVYKNNKAFDKYEDEEQAIQAVEENNEASHYYFRRTFGDLENIDKLTGRNIYQGIRQMSGYQDKNASLKLLKYGVKGITYAGTADGRCYVVFDDKAISIIEKFNQGIKGSITPMSNGQRIINIFESADESTFLHEMGHLFLLDLEELAQIDEKSAQELATVTEWATYKKEDVKGYKGTPFESEFLKLAANIEAAEKNGDIATAEQLKRKWMHERFARAFEMYLEFGQAPSTGLKSVFRKFKQFLIHIYIGFTGEGVRATPEVERIMARMIASDSEIEAAALSDRYKDITKAGGEKLLTETESETMARWHEEAKAEAKEKLLAIIMKDLKEEKAREYQAKLDKEREEVTRFIESQPVFIAQKVLSENGGSKEDVVAMGIYGSIEQLEADLDKVKDILPDRAIEDRMADYAKELDQQMIDEQITEEKISEIMNRTYYHNKLLALETAALEDRTRSLQRISSKTKNAIDEANIALDGIEDNTNIKKAKYSDGVKKLLKALSKLRVSKQWNGEELQAIDKIINSTTKEEASDALKEFVNRQGEWKRNLKNVQEAFDGRMKLMDKMAREELAKKSLADACNYGKYVRMEKQASQMMNKFIRLGKWEAALRQQEIRLQAAAMAKYAKKNQEQLKKLTDRVKKQLTAKTVKLPKDERYWHRRMAYLLNLAKENPAEPVDGVVPLREIFKGLNDSLDIQEMDFTDIYKTITRDGFGGYMTLTMAELEDAVNMLTVLYTTGRDKFRVKSFDGMNLSDVVDEICEDETGIGIMTQNRFINPDQGGVGYNDLLANIPHIGEVLSRAGQKYITSMVKPELLLKLIGNKAYKYIYGLYERAANQEGKMSAESIRKLQEILSVYSHDEKRDWKTKKYTFETGAGVEKLSKENIICMALNRGNETNWNRLAKGMRVQFEDLAKFIDEHMTAKDWQTVQAIWDYLDSYWEDTTRVEEKLNGITMKKVQRRPFWVKPKGNDKYIKLEGGYYPIAYNPEKSAKAEAQSVDAAAQRTMSGAQVLGTGRGFTKARNESMNISRPLKLSFDVITEHTSNVIHNITWRLACRDVYRLTHSTKFEELIRNTLGAEALRSINEWVVDCWKTMPGATDQATGTINKLFGWLRRNAGFNIMGYRMWPAVENVTNIFPMMDQLGAADTMAAIGDYYAHKTENDRLILRSSFMTNRINNMDRDIKNIPGLFDESMRGLGWMKQHAYSMLAYTDLMLSAPLWCRAYKNSIAKHYMEVEKENKEQVAAFKSAQDRVHELNTAMYDLKREKEKILLKLHPEYEEEYTPMRAKEIGYLNSELNRINKELAPMEKARWQAELELDKLANVDLMLPDDILKEAEERAVHSADAAVRNVFGSGHIKDLAPIQKGGEFAKMLTCFYSFFNTQANAILAAYYQGKFAKADISGLQNISVWMPMAKSILFRIFLTSALTTVLKMALLGDGSDDKDKYRKIKLEDGTEVKEEIPQLERFLTEYAKNTISTASGTLWGIRDIAGAITNYIFEGNDFGGARFASVPSIAIEKSIKTFEMAMQKGERDARIEADEERRKARYDKMTPKQKKKFDEELQYRHPPKRITWADIWKMGVGAITSVTAAETGITDTVANTVMTTLQYMADGDGRYDPSIENIFWSAFWNKKPVERAIPEKPVQPKNNKKKKGA